MVSVKQFQRASYDCLIVRDNGHSLCKCWGQSANQQHDRRTTALPLCHLADDRSFSALYSGVPTPWSRDRVCDLSYSAVFEEEEEEEEEGG